MTASKKTVKATCSLGKADIDLPTKGNGFVNPLKLALQTYAILGGSYIGIDTKNPNQTAKQQQTTRAGSSKPQEIIQERHGLFHSV